MENKCPDCGTNLKYALGIGPFCPNKKCNTLDNIVKDYNIKLANMEVQKAMKEIQKKHFKPIHEIMDFKFMGYSPEELKDIIYFAKEHGYGLEERKRDEIRDITWAIFHHYYKDTIVDHNEAADIIVAARKYEGIYDLLKLWEEETDEEERKEILKDIIGMVKEVKKYE